jgi:conjugal transfer pilus assembly protein TraW
MPTQKGRAMLSDPEDPRARRPGGKWRLVAFQAGVIVLLAGALALAITARARTSTIGRTWSVAEPDALAEIEARIARQPPSMAARFGPRSDWSALKPAPLAIAKDNRVRSVVPFHTLEFDLALPDGKVLYPRGYTFNPLSYVSLPQRLIVVHARDLGWAMRTASLTDWILLSEGGGPHADALTLGERLGRPVFVLEERVKERLGLTHAPVIVRQLGERLELTEVRLERAGSRKVTP